MAENTPLSFDGKNTGTFSFHWGWFVTMDTNTPGKNSRPKSTAKGIKRWRVSISSQIMDAIKVGGSALKENRNLHRFCPLCVAPAGSWAAPLRSDHPAWSCHPHPSPRTGAFAGSFPHSSCPPCAPSRVRGEQRLWQVSFLVCEGRTIMVGVLPFLHHLKVEAGPCLSAELLPQWGLRHLGLPIQSPPV